MQATFEGNQLIDSETGEIFGVPGLFNCQRCGASFQIIVDGPTTLEAEGDGACGSTHVFEDAFLVSP